MAHKRYKIHKDNFDVANVENYKVNSYSNLSLPNYALKAGSKELGNQSNKDKLISKVIRNRDFNYPLSIEMGREKLELTPPLKDIAPQRGDKDVNLYIYNTTDAFRSPEYNKFNFMSSEYLKDVMEKADKNSKKTQQAPVENFINIFPMKETIEFFGEYVVAPLNEIKEKSGSYFTEMSDDLKKWIFANVLAHWTVSGTNLIPLLKDIAVSIPDMIKSFFSYLIKKFKRAYSVCMRGKEIYFMERVYTGHIRVGGGANPAVYKSSFLKMPMHGGFFKKLFHQLKVPKINTSFIKDFLATDASYSKGMIKGGAISIFLVEAYQIGRIIRDPSERGKLSEFLAQQIVNIYNMSMTITITTLIGSAISASMISGEVMAKNPSGLLAWGVFTGMLAVGVVVTCIWDIFGFGPGEEEKKALVEFLQPVDDYEKLKKEIHTYQGCSKAVRGFGDHLENFYTCAKQNKM